MKKDIENPSHIRELVEHFYGKIRIEGPIAHFFTDIAEQDLPAHLDTITLFWQQILFGGYVYNGPIMEKHLQLARRFGMQQSHFDFWLKNFQESVDQLFAGPNAEEVKSRAQSISQIMAFKTSTENKQGPS